MSSLVDVDIDSAVTADADFPVVHSLADLSSVDVDSVYTWNESTLRLRFGECFSAPIGFTTNRYWSQTQYGLRGLSDAPRAFHPNTLSPRDAILLSDNHAVWLISVSQRSFLEGIKSVTTTTMTGKSIAFAL